MYLTEEQAREKWCQKSGPILLAATLLRTEPMNEASLEVVERRSNCIASACMMWLWVDSETGFCGLAKC